MGQIDMEKRSNTVRTNISIPRALKQAMEKVKEPVNWSRIAATAFEQRLAEIAARKQSKSLDEVARRLRLSQQRTTKMSLLFREGYELGRRWAENQASVEGLTRLEELKDELGTDWGSNFKTTSEDRASACQLLAMRLHPEWEEAEDWTLARDWWKEVGDGEEKKAYQADYLRGFAEGALDLWSKVKDLV